MMKLIRKWHTSSIYANEEKKLQCNVTPTTKISQYKKYTAERTGDECKEVSPAYRQWFEGVNKSKHGLLPAPGSNKLQKEHSRQTYTFLDGANRSIKWTNDLIECGRRTRSLVQLEKVINGTSWQKETWLAWLRLRISGMHFASIFHAQFVSKRFHFLFIEFRKGILID